jgi:hypothetical protein
MPKMRRTHICCTTDDWLGFPMDLPHGHSIVQTTGQGLFCPTCDDTAHRWIGSVRGVRHRAAHEPSPTAAKHGWGSDRIRPPGHGTGKLWSRSRAVSNAKPLVRIRKPKLTSLACPLGFRHACMSPEVTFKSGSLGNTTEVHLILGSKSRSPASRPAPLSVPSHRKSGRQPSASAADMQPAICAFRPMTGSSRNVRSGSTLHWRFMGPAPSCS